MKLQVLFILSWFSFSQENKEIDSLIGVAVSKHYEAPSYADSLYEVVIEKSEKVNYIKGIALAEKGLGVVDDVRGKQEESLVHYKKSFEAFMEIKDSLNAFKSVFNEGMIYRKLKQIELAKDAFKKAAVVFENYDFEYGVVLCDVNIGIIHFDSKQYRTALGHFKEAYGKMKNLGGSDVNLLMNMGNCYYKLQEKDSAFFYLDKAYEMALATKHYQSFATMQNTLGHLYLDRKQFDKAENLYLSALKFAEDKEQWSSVASIQMSLGKLYREKGVFEKAYDYLRKGVKLKDSIANKDFELELSEKEAVIQNEKKKHEIALLEEKDKLAQEEIHFAREIRLYLSIVLVLILCIAILLFFQSKRRRSMNKVLSDKNEQIEEQHKEITDSINYAKQIQTALLTSDAEWSKISHDFFVLFKPKDVVSGDFFWALEHEEEGLSIWVAADCTGHGVPGAFMSMLGIGFLNEIIIENKVLEADEILNKLREKIISALQQKNVNTQRKDGIDMSLCIWNKKKNELVYAGANNPIYVVRNKSMLKPETELKEENTDFGLIEYAPDKMPVGAHTDELKAFNQTLVQLEKGDMIYSFTDGYADQFGGKSGKKYKYKQFRQYLLSLSSIPANEQKQKLDEEFESWKGELEQIDDVCVIGVRV